MTDIQWIGVDWGTSNLRAYAIDRSGNVIDQQKSDQGMGGLAPDQFEPALIGLIEPWLNDEHMIPVFACGMVGAKQGWQEAKYRHVPCPPVAKGGLTQVQIIDTRLSFYIVPGLCQTSPADVMRGEETQIAGLMEHHPNFSGSVCLPGTHSKWARVKGGSIDAFQTFMTGELFALLSTQSILRHSVLDSDFDMQIFLETGLQAVEDPMTACRNLFNIRAESLLNEQSAFIAKAKLSGLMIGQELAASKDYWLDQNVTLIGNDRLCKLYEILLKGMGITVVVIDASDATLAGLKQIAHWHQN